jgi:exonuclease VII large subunit
VTPNGESRLDRIEAMVDRVGRSIEHLFLTTRQHAQDIDRHTQDIDQLRERADRQDKALDRITSILERLAELSVANQEAQAEFQARIERAHALYEEERRRGAEVHRELEEKLNALIQIVDETIRKKPRNGDQPKPD